MLVSSAVVVSVGLLLGAIGFGAFIWAFWVGAFESLEEQARCIFDERDLRMRRPWETPGQARERRRLYGGPLEPGPGEWGGDLGRGGR